VPKLGNGIPIFSGEIANIFLVPLLTLVVLHFLFPEIFSLLLVYSLPLLFILQLHGSKVYNIHCDDQIYSAGYCIFPYEIDIFYAYTAPFLMTTQRVFMVLQIQ